MAVFYIDPVNGNDTYSGKAFGAPELVGTDGRFGADYYHFISDAGGFTGRVGQYIRVNATYNFLIAEVISDTQIRTATAIPGWSPPIPFVIGGAFQTALPLGTGYFTVNAGDEIRIAKTPYCDPAGPNSMTYTNKSKTVTFASGRMKLLEQCESGWSASADVAVAYYNYYMLQGTYYLQVKEAGAFTTGKMAWKEISEVDLSDFQGISLGVKCENDLITAGHFKICLCSDTAGDTVVDEFLVQPKGLYPTTPWIPTRTMKEGGGNLGASIKSIAVYAITNIGNSPWMGFDNIIAIKDFGDADHLCHGCILTQSTEFPADHWGIDGFDSDTTLSLTYAFYGVDGAQDTYTRETHNCKRLFFNVAITGAEPILNPLIISGGWDTATDEKNGLTVLGRVFKGVYSESDVANVSFGYVSGIKLSNMLLTGTNLYLEYQCNYITLEDIVLAPGSLGQYNYGQGIMYANSYIYADNPILFWTLRNIYICGSHYGALYNFQKSIYSNYYRDGSFGWVIDGLYMRSAGHLDIGGFAGLRAKNVESLWGNQQQGGIFADQYCEDIEINGLKIIDPGSCGIDFAYGGKDIRILNLDSSGATSTLINAANVDLKLLNPIIAESTKFTGLQFLGRIARINDGGAAGVHVIDTYYGRIVSEAAVRHTASGISWKLSPTNTPKLPLRMKVATVAVKAGIEIDLSLWMRRTHTGLLGRLFIPGGYVGGIETEASVGMGADSADVYRQYTLTVTPTEDGVIEAWVEAQGGTTYSLYVDDFEVV